MYIEALVTAQEMISLAAQFTTGLIVIAVFLYVTDERSSVNYEEEV